LPYRRIYKRFICNDSAVLFTKDGTEERLILQDLSLGGAGVFGNYPLNINEGVTVAINAPFFFKRSFGKNARVAWSKQVDTNAWEAGLDFSLAH
jgi:hypothetical protein